MHLFATGDPTMYFRPDGTAAIVYRWSNEIWELSAVNGGATVGRDAA